MVQLMAQQCERQGLFVIDLLLRVTKRKHIAEANSLIQVKPFQILTVVANLKKDV